MQELIRQNKVYSIIITFTIITFAFCFIYKNFLLQSSISIAGFVGLFLHFLNRIGKDFPIKELMIVMLGLQLLISPLIAYHYFNNNMEFIMLINESTYIWFVLIYILMFAVGLFIPITKNNQTTKLNISLNKKNYNSKIGLFLIVFGFSAYFLGKYTPASLKFVFYLFAYCRLIGALVLIFSNLNHKYLISFFVFAQFAYIIISGAIFYDLIIWGFFFYMAFELKLRSSFYKKVFFSIIGISSLLFLQSIKSEYRKEIWTDDRVEQTSNFNTFVNVLTDSRTSIEEKEKSNFEHLVDRLNTGWIISAVLIHVPNYQNYTNGDLLIDDIKNVLLPRFLVPNKKSVGGSENRAKFEKFTGRKLGDDTTMRIGVIADAYINFGPYGGAALMLFFGLLINYLIGMFRTIFNNSIHYLWVLFIFSFTVRMSDFIVILNSTIKSIFIFLIVLFIMNKLFPSFTITKSNQP